MTSDNWEKLGETVRDIWESVVIVRDFLSWHPFGIMLFWLGVYVLGIVGAACWWVSR